MAARPPLEARSLSTINALAANPPQYPHYPEVREPLTLYISRVPGTRDVILSTFRPRKKNVTNEDVAASLYYVHLDLPTDEQIMPAPRPQETAYSPRSSGESARSTIPRKPLPSTARVARPESAAYSPDASVQPTVSGNTQSDQHSSTIPRPTSSGSPDSYRPNPMFQPRQQPGDAPEERPQLPPRPPPNFPAPAGTPVTRKPLGTRPQSALLPHDHDFQLSGGAGRPVTPTQAATSPRAGTPTHMSPTRLTIPYSSSPPKRAFRQPASMAPFSLSLIRRDPATGAQWNIGKISSFQTNIPTPDMADPNLNPDDMGDVSARAHKIDIHIASSGYAKYRNMPSRANVEASYRPSSPPQSFREALQGLSMASSTLEVPIPQKAGPVDEGFTRQVVMSYSRTLRSNIKEVLRRRDRPVTPPEGAPAMAPEDLLPPQRPGHRRQGSSSTVGSGESSGGAGFPPGTNENMPPYMKQPTVTETKHRERRDSSPHTLITTPGPGLRPKGYVFASPWDGRCEFSTSSNGRALKCRHILDYNTAKKFDPATLAQNLREAKAAKQAAGGRPRGDSLGSALVGAKAVSELRFNLPSPDLFKASAKEPSSAVSGKFAKLLHKVEQHQHKKRGNNFSSGDEDEYYESDEDTGFDLSLGKEKAGGGNRGKRVKLGKLIIYDEGLKMLDLVVAANVGVWWTTWEKSV